MKTWSGLCLAGLLILGSACSDDNGNNLSVTVEGVKDVVQSGTWRITKFVDSGKDETSYFNGYSFTFSTDFKVVATNGSATVNGAWYIDLDDDLDDIDFVIQMVAVNKFAELNEDWDIVRLTSSKLELKDDDSSNSGDDDDDDDDGPDYLTFEKN